MAFKRFLLIFEDFLHISRIIFDKNYMIRYKISQKRTGEQANKAKFLWGLAECARRVSIKICSTRTRRLAHQLIFLHPARNHRFDPSNLQLENTLKLLVIQSCRGSLDQPSYDGVESSATKGQLSSEWIYEVIVCPKITTKNYRDFCTASLLLQG